MSPSRRLLRQGLVLVVLVVLAMSAVALLLRSDAPANQAADQARPGPVLLVPGYGGSTASLEVLAGALRTKGRTAEVVRLPGDGTGDLRQAAAALDAVAQRLLAGGAPSVDVVGYSAGGVVTRLWARDHAAQVRRVVTLGAPHHGTGVAALGAVLAPGACPLACQQLVPGNALLDELNKGDETPAGPEWLSLWTEQDEVVTPPDSARLAGATDVALQQVCPGLQVGHGELPRDPTVTRIVEQALDAPSITAPTPTVCVGI